MIRSGPGQAGLRDALNISTLTTRTPRTLALYAEALRDWMLGGLLVPSAGGGAVQARVLEHLMILAENVVERERAAVCFWGIDVHRGRCRR